jgi:hypothetical protein
MNFQKPLPNLAGRAWRAAVLGLTICLVAGGAPAQTTPAEPATATATAPAATASQGVDQDVQTLKKQVVDLNRDLFKLEEELLFPASTQVAVFLSVDVGTFFALDSVTVKLDDKEVAHYLYTDREVAALHRGGVQKLYLGNVKAGPHELVAFFTGKGPHDRDYRRGATLRFDKEIGAKYVELRISDQVATLEPEFLIREWE